MTEHTLVRDDHTLAVRCTTCRIDATLGSLPFAECILPDIREAAYQEVRSAGGDHYDALMAYANPTPR